MEEVLRQTQPMTPTLTMSGSISIQNKKRARVSWTEENYIVIKEVGGSRRRCSHCTRTWSITTCTSTIAKHLNDKHGIVVIVF